MSLVPRDTVAEAILASRRLKKARGARAVLPPVEAAKPGAVQVDANQDTIDHAPVVGSDPAVSVTEKVIVAVPHGPDVDTQRIAKKAKEHGGEQHPTLSHEVHFAGSSAAERAHKFVKDMPKETRAGALIAYHEGAMVDGELKPLFEDRSAADVHKERISAVKDHETLKRIHAHLKRATNHHTHSVDAKMHYHALRKHLVTHAAGQGLKLEAVEDLPAEVIEEGAKEHTFSFHPGDPDGAKRVVWKRMGKHAEEVHKLAKAAALKDYPKAHSFKTESPQHEAVVDETDAVAMPTQSAAGPQAQAPVAQDNEDPEHAVSGGAKLTGSAGDAATQAGTAEVDRPDHKESADEEGSFVVEQEHETAIAVEVKEEAGQPVHVARHHALLAHLEKHGLHPMSHEVVNQNEGKPGKPVHHVSKFVFGKKSHAQKARMALSSHAPEGVTNRHAAQEHGAVNVHHNLLNPYKYHEAQGSFLASVVGAAAGRGELYEAIVELSAAGLLIGEATAPFAAIGEMRVDELVKDGEHVVHVNYKVGGEEQAKHTVHHLIHHAMKHGATKFEADGYNGHVALHFKSKAQASHFHGVASKAAHVHKATVHAVAHESAEKVVNEDGVGPNKAGPLGKVLVTLTRPMGVSHMPLEWYLAQFGGKAAAGGYEFPVETAQSFLNMYMVNGGQGHITVNGQKHGPNESIKHPEHLEHDAPHLYHDSDHVRHKEGGSEMHHEGKWHPMSDHANKAYHHEREARRHLAHAVRGTDLSKSKAEHHAAATHHLRLSDEHHAAAPEHERNAMMKHLRWHYNS